MIAAWLVITLLSGQPLAQKQIRVEPRACHLPAVRGEYPINGEWRPVTVSIRCGR